MKKELTRFIVRKYVMADSAAGALKNERKTPVHDVWVDEKWVEQQIIKSDFSGVGFQTDKTEKEKK